MAASIPGLTIGQLEKMQIISFTNPERTSGKKQFEVMFNPNTFSNKFEIKYDDRRVPGAVSEKPIFNHVKSNAHSFEFLFDGTGASGPRTGSGISVSAPGLGDKFPVESVSEKIDEFFKVVWEFEGKIHRPRYLIMCWGDWVSHCVCRSADVNYTLFDPSGKPLRAKIKAEFGEDDFKVKQKKAKISSPDLTHIKTVEEDASLALMSDEIYNDSSYYIQVARANKLKHFRRLRTGQELKFPPLKSDADS